MEETTTSGLAGPAFGDETPDPTAVLGGTLRAFIALELPQSVRASIDQCLRPLLSSPAAKRARVKWVAPESLHLTLKFLGRVEVAQLPAVRGALRETASRHLPFDLALGGPGCFPEPLRASVLWLGLQGNLSALADLAASLERSLSQLGFATENRAFNPHVTLGRVGAPSSAPDIVAELFAAATGLGGSLPAEQLVLFRSDTLPGGARYTSLARFALGTPLQI